MKEIIYILFVFPFLMFSQTSKIDSIWSTFKPFIGYWSGTGTGEPGNGKYTRSYQYIFGNTFIEINNKSTYEPTEKHPKGEVHEDKGYISYDKKRKKFVLRQFHKESFVIQYLLDSVSSDGATLVFITEVIENIPSGWRAKETYQLSGTNKLVETFELSEPDKEFMIYTKTELNKQN